MSAPHPTEDAPSPNASSGPTSGRVDGRIQCWGHRGASADLPENTLASYRAAILEGAEGIESDVHATTDGVVLMFHDPTLDRTTDGRGRIKEQKWEGGIEHVRTRKQPVQPIPRFEELVALIMEPENRHVILNIDCKIQNDPETLFIQMAKIIASYPDADQNLTPRIILGLWHPLFLLPAARHLPTCKRYHIGISFPLARRFFWRACDGFSMAFPMLMSAEGQRFLEECKREGKRVCAWTVNGREEMVWCKRMGVEAIITDRVAFCVGVREEWERDPTKLEPPPLRKLIFPWSSWKYYSVPQMMILRWVEDHLQKNAYAPGPLMPVDLDADAGGEGK
ncbi:hypothetical protein NliqN6_0146 [Naganishia liquefaciens]|uniref:GP-PDE domain-containing protein n=1 Tax=Naganishia liquefaciens TaxID=104408 RepID=A0A8H3TMU9_9TREE|nr:hypothetical protein NliqN6_0146 [Naganishia liquefaciens]